MKRQTLTSPVHARSREPLLSTLREGFHQEIFRDLHDHLFECFGRPSLVAVVRRDGGLKASLPRKREPLPDEFYHHLISATSNAHSLGMIEDDKLSKVSELLRLPPSERRWGWHATSRGLVDLYLPIEGPPDSRNPELAELLGVLVLGRFRAPISTDLEELHSWLDRLPMELRETRVFTPGSGPNEEYRSFLHSLVDRIPILTPSLERRIQYEAQRSVSLLGRFLGRIARAEMLFGEHGLISRLGLAEPGPSITLERLWDQIRNALGHIVTFLDLEIAVAYSASDQDYSNLQLKAVASRGFSPPEELALASLEEFSWLCDETWVNLPRSNTHFAWLDPASVLGAPEAIAFGRATVGGNITLLLFAFETKNRLAPSQRTALYDAVASRVFPFLHAAFTAIELDILMAETGHLLGKAIGKVSSGIESLRDLLPADLRSQTKHLAELRQAEWTIDDGLESLNLLRANFYSFPVSRRMVDSSIEEAQATEAGEEVDVVEVLESMRAFFVRAIEQSPLQEIKFNILSEALPVLGERESLRVVLLNLLDNAIKFSYANTFCTVAAHSREGSAVVAMTNLGVGVPKSEWQYVFRRLARSRPLDPHRRIDGLGLGLPYCKRIIEDVFRGTITLRSHPAPTPHRRRFRSDNWLTTVEISIPLLTAKQGITR